MFISIMYFAQSKQCANNHSTRVIIWAFMRKLDLHSTGYNTINTIINNRGDRIAVWSQGVNVTDVWKSKSSVSQHPVTSVDELPSAFPRRGFKRLSVLPDRTWRYAVMGWTGPQQSLPLICSQSSYPIHHSPPLFLCCFCVSGCDITGEAASVAHTYTHTLTLHTHIQ